MESPSVQVGEPLPAQLPTPPASPQSKRKTSKSVIINTVEKKEVLLVRRPKTPTEPEAVEASEPAAVPSITEQDRNASAIAALKETLRISSGRCGSKTKKKDTTCRIRRTEKVPVIETVLATLLKPGLSSENIEARLRDIAEIFHCTCHDDPRHVELRIDRWFSSLPPDENGQQRPETARRQLLGSFPLVNNCAAINKGNKKPCANKISEEDGRDASRTAREMVLVAIGSSKENLELLVKVLHHSLLCGVHKATLQIQESRNSEIKEFENACREEMLHRRARKTRTRVEVGVEAVIDKSGLLPPPPSPGTAACKDEVANYWKNRLGTSPFHKIGKKGDLRAEGITTEEAIRKLAETVLCAHEDKAKDEVHSGSIYAYSVPGNEGFVKIGFTTGDIKYRHGKWKKDCKREIIDLYPGQTTSAKIPHAHRVESLVHEELMEHRVRIFCHSCDKQHREWFEVSPAQARASIAKWSQWISKNPYEEVSTADNETQWQLKSTERAKLANIANFLEHPGKDA